jgi:hypothetical protein
VTGTAAADLLATIKTGEAAARRDLRARLVAERLTGQSQEESYTNAVMQRGVDLEPVAFGLYESLTGRFVDRVGFLEHDELAAGCSLDGALDGLAGILEIKCPKTATHLRYLRLNEAPAEHLPQIRHNLWISGAAWCDFVSFDDRLPTHLQMTILRVMAADVDLPGYEAKVRAFLAEVDNEYDALMGWKGAA